jgi:biotin carboxyl carrier protein
VEAGTLLLATDFMGMENDVFAPAKGVVLSVAVAVGDFVRPGHELLTLQTQE